MSGNRLVIIMARSKPNIFADQPAYPQLVAHLAKEEAFQEVEWEYELGVLVDTLCPRGNRAYGENRIEKLAAAVGGDSLLARRLWYARKLPAAISRQDLQALLRYAKKKNFILTNSHVLTLEVYKDDEERMTIARLAIANRWSVRALRREIYARQGRRKGVGPPLAQARSRQDALSEMRESCESWLLRYEQRWFGGEGVCLTQPLRRSERESFSEQYIEVEELLTQLERAAADARRKMAKVRH